MHYRRTRLPGGTFFFTVVTQGRRPILADHHVLAALRRSFKRARHERPFHLDAVVVLPDHLHCIWELPQGDLDFSTRWAAIKAGVSRQLDRAFDQGRSPSRASKGERGIWQRRFWEHRVRDEAALNALRDYIHFNPVKHGLVASPAGWMASSFHRYARMGLYPTGWSADPGDIAPE